MEEEARVAQGLNEMGVAHYGIPSWKSDTCVVLRDEDVTLRIQQAQ